jgi:P-type E1-E2 ATPase
VPLALDIPGPSRLAVDVVVLDVNGTLTDRGELLPDVPGRLSRLAADFRLILASADTFGTLDRVAQALGAEARPAGDASSKVALLDELGRDRCAMVGNGANDAAALRAAALGIAVIGPEGASAEALMAADVICTSILEALDLLVDEQALTATLRR